MHQWCRVSWITWVPWCPVVNQLWMPTSRLRCLPKRIVSPVLTHVQNRYSYSIILVCPAVLVLVSGEWDSLICLAADVVYINADYIKFIIKHSTQYSNSIKSHWNHHRNLEKYPSENCTEHIEQTTRCAERVLTE